MTYMTAAQLSQQYQSVLKPANKPEHEVSQITSTSDKYEVKLSIHQFTPDELSVKVVDRYVHVDGRHEEKSTKVGCFTRTFTRRYFLPEGVPPEKVRCTFNLDGNLLTITAPIVHKTPLKEYIIPIVVVGLAPPPPQPSTSSEHRERERHRQERREHREHREHRERSYHHTK